MVSTTSKHSWTPPANWTLIDAFAGAGDLAAKVHELDEAIQKTEAELPNLLPTMPEKLSVWTCSVSSAMRFKRRIPKPGETEAAHQQLAVLSHATKLLDAATRGYEQLYESDNSVSSVLSQTERALRDAAQYDKRLEPLAAQAESARIQIQDVASGLRDYCVANRSQPRRTGTASVAARGTGTAPSKIRPRPAGTPRQGKRGNGQHGSRRSTKR